MLSTGRLRRFTRRSMCSAMIWLALAASGLRVFVVVVMVTIYDTPKRLSTSFFVPYVDFPWTAIFLAQMRVAASGSAPSTARGTGQGDRILAPSTGRDRLPIPWACPACGG